MTKRHHANGLVCGVLNPQDCLICTPDWKRVVEVLQTQAMPTYGSNADLYQQAIRLCIAASRLPEGVDPIGVLEDITKDAEGDPE